MSAIVSAAFVARRRCRDAFEEYREAQYQRAHEECNGVLLNRLGKARGVDAYSLFIGSTDRAHLYASDELQAWWAHESPRRTYRQFEQGWIADEYGVL